MSTILVVPEPVEPTPPKRQFVAPVRPWWLPVLEASGIAAWLFFWFSMAYRTANGFSLGVPGIILAVSLGILASDFMSGFLHWLFDTFFEITTPIIGPHLVGPFREHHWDPLAMTRHGALESAGNSCLGWLPALFLLWWFGPVAPSTWVGAFNYWFWLTWALLLTFSNQLHSWAHDPNVSRFARLLQRWGLAVSPEHHAPHHVRPHNVRYCTTTGWVNYLVDRFSLFAYAEKALVALGFPLKGPEIY
jgi:hypothetical protein